MATTRRNTKKETEKKENNKMKPVEIIKDWSLWYRENEYGIFGLEHNGAVIFGCRLVERRDGGVFISFPSRKGTDGKWYAHAMFWDVPDEVVEAIADAIGF